MREVQEKGAAVVTVLLVILAITVLAHGTLLLARAEWRAAQAGARHLKAEAAADAALALAMLRSLGVERDSLSIMDVDTALAMTLGGVPATGLFRRLSREAWLIEGVAGPVGVSPVRSGRLGWALDPLARVSALEAVVEVGAGAPVQVDGHVDGAAPLDRREPLDPSACRSWEPELSQAFGVAPLPRIAFGDTLPTLGLLDLGSMLSRTETHLVGRGTPGPVDRFGRCEDSVPWNWGDPEAPNGVCGSHLALRASAGDIVVDGGVGQGVLLAAGDVTFRNGARFYGMVVAGGGLVVEDGAELEGLFVATAGLRVASGSSIRGAACWALRTLAAARASLGGPLIIPGVGRIGPR